MRHSLLPLSFLLVPSLAWAGTINVPADQPTIADAITAAVSGDEIVLAPGTYDEFLTVDKDLTITGSGAPVTKLKSTSATEEEIISLVSGSLHVENLTFTGAGGTHRAVTASAATRFEAVGVTFSGLSSITNGGAIESTSADIVIDECDFSATTAADSGGAIYAVGGTVTVTSSSMRNCTATNAGGGIFAYSTTDVVIDGVGFEKDTVAANGSPGEGGALYVLSATLDLHDNLFCSNSAPAGGAVMADQVVDGLVRNNVFAENGAGNYGGGLYWFEGGQPEIVDNTFAGNTANVIGGGGGALFDGVLFDFRNNIITRSGNQSTGISGTNYNIGDVITIEYSLFFQNGGGDLGSDLAAHSFSPTNILGVDPELLFWGNDGNCYVDAFYTSATSPAIDAGDPNIIDVGGSLSDIGAYGGPGAHVVDGDGDGWENVYDCDESDSTIYPGALEVCDFQDNDCDGVVDQGFQTLWYADSDTDGFGDPNVTNNGCVTPPGFVGNSDDCDDSDFNIRDERDWYLDQDQDGLGNLNATTHACFPPTGYVGDSTDCDDSNAAITNEVDWYGDADNDGFGDPLVVQQACFRPSGYVSNDDDCGPSSANIYPGAPDACRDLVDSDCDGVIDEPDGTGTLSYYQDLDADGHGNPAVSVVACNPPTGYVPSGDDCDDTNAARFGGNPELCDGIDNNCDTAGLIDENAPSATLRYPDLDGDQHGAGDGVPACDLPEGYSNTDDDCNDEEGRVFPGNPEVCDGLDNNCENGVDDNAADARTWYPDNDGDGLGSGTSTSSCQQPAGQVSNHDDCDDADPEQGKCVTCGCSTQGPRGGLGMALLVALIAVGRRRARY